MVKGYTKKVFDETDQIAERHYKSCKMMLALTRGREGNLAPRQAQHFKDMEEFVLGYELGRYKHIWDFYKSPEKIVEEWRNLTPKEHAKRLEDNMRGWKYAEDTSAKVGA